MFDKNSRLIEVKESQEVMNAIKYQAADSLLFKLEDMDSSEIKQIIHILFHEKFEGGIYQNELMKNYSY